MILSVCPNPSVDTYVHFSSFMPQEVNRATQEQPFPGGKGIHVAMGIKELGEEVTLLGFWAGPSGQWVKHQLEEKGIRCIGPEVDGWTRNCYTFKTGDDFNETEILGLGPTVSKNDLNTFYELYDKELAHTNIAVMSGSWPQGAPDNSYAVLIGFANKHKVPVVLDATGDLLANAIQKHPAAIHLNKSETAAFTGKQNIMGMLMALAENIEVAAVTDGKNGLFYLNNKKVLHGNVLIDKVVSAVGSGDSLTAGLTVAMLRGYNNEGTVRLSVACGAANCLRHELGMFYKKDVERLLNKVVVEEFKMEIT